MPRLDEEASSILQDVDDTLEGITGFLDNVVKARLLVYVESKPNKTSDGLHRASTSLALMKVWLASEDYLNFANELPKLKTLPALMRKFKDENPRNARIRRRIVGMQVTRLLNLTYAMCKSLLKDADVAASITGVILPP